MTSTDPYEPPTSSSAAASAAPFSHAASMSITIFTSLVYSIALYASAKFAEIFVSFGAELPWLTRALLPGSIIYYLIPGLCLLGYIGRWMGFRAARPILIFCSIVSFLTIPLFIVAMYLPIFHLGAAAGS